MSHVLELSKKMASIAYHALDSKKGQRRFSSRISSR